MDEPTTWQVELLLRDNIREAQQRMERDVLLFGLLSVIYVVLAAAIVNEISAVGIKITEPRYAQFAIVPYGVLIWLRFLKAQSLRDAAHSQLKTRGSRLPLEAGVIDWSLSGDRQRRWQLLQSYQSRVTPAMMLIGVVAGYSYNFMNSDGVVWWAMVTLVVGAAFGALMWAGHDAWSKSFYDASEDPR